MRKNNMLISPSIPRDPEEFPDELRAGDLLTIHEITAEFGIPKATVRGWIDSGKLPNIQIPGRGRFALVNVVHRSEIAMCVDNWNQARMKRKRWLDRTSIKERDRILSLIDQASTDTVFSVSAVCGILECSDKTLRKWIIGGSLKAEKSGDFYFWRISRDELKRFITDNLAEA